MARAANSCRIDSRLPGSSAFWNTTIVVLSWPVGRRDAGRGRSTRTGSRSRGGPRCRRPAPRARRSPPPARCRSRRRWRRPRRRTCRAASAVELDATNDAAAQLLVQERPALRGGHGDRHDALHVGQRRSGQAEQVHLHGDHDLALDQHVGVEREGVEGDVDRAFDGVLERNDTPRSTSPDVIASITSVIDGKSTRSAGGEIGLREQRLLAERAGRTEIGDPRHDRAG